jgi:hypothetical protein
VYYHAVKPRPLGFVGIPHTDGEVQFEVMHYPVLPVALGLSFLYCVSYKKS